MANERKILQSDVKLSRKGVLEAYFPIFIHSSPATSTTTCHTLRKILHTKIHDRTLRGKLLTRTPCQNEGESRWLLSLRALMTCSTTTNDPKPLEAMWEPCGNMKKANWSKYSKSASYNTPWLLANGWENGSSSEVFTLDMLEESHSEASFGHQDYQEAAVVTSHNFTEVEESTMG
ncbi:unnamed protein product [Prunus armeniaca]